MKKKKIQTEQKIISKQTKNFSDGIKIVFLVSIFLIIIELMNYFIFSRTSDGMNLTIKLLIRIFASFIIFLGIMMIVVEKLRSKNKKKK